MARRLVLVVVSLSTLACGGVPTITIGPPPAEPAPVVADAPAPSAPVGSAPAPVAPAKGASAKATPVKAAATPASAKKVRAGADPGEIQVTTAAAVALYVDGVPATFDIAEGYVFGGLPPGEHQLEIVNALGKTVATRTVSVGSGERVRLRYKAGGQLTDAGVVPILVREEPVVVAAAPAEPPPAGSVQISGLRADEGTVWVGGGAVPFDGTHGYLARGLAPGLHELRVEANGRAVYQGDVEVRDDENHRCVIGYSWQTDAYTIDCHWTQPL